MPIYIYLYEEFKIKPIIETIQTDQLVKCRPNAIKNYHLAETFALVVFAVGHLLQLAFVTTNPSLPYEIK